MRDIRKRLPSRPSEPNDPRNTRVVDSNFLSRHFSAHRSRATVAMADVQHNTTGAASTTAELASQLPIVQGPSAPQTSDADRDTDLEAHALVQGHAPTTNENHEGLIAPAAPTRGEDDLAGSSGSPVGSRVDSQTTHTGDSTSFNEKHHSKLEHDNDNVDAEGKNKKKKGKKEAAKEDKRSPFEIAMENPELANLREDHRRAIAEQM